MSCFEKSTAGKSQGRQIERITTVLRVRVLLDGRPEQSWYIDCHSELAARTEMERLVAEWTREGFLPVDSSAKDLAESLPPEPSREDDPCWPLRRDLQLDPDGAGLVVASLQAARQLKEIAETPWRAAVEQDWAIPLALVASDRIHVRVVGGEELSTAEQEEAVACLRHPLEISDGCLVVAVGPWPCEALEDPAQVANYAATVEVPPGRYDVTLRTYLPGANGRAVVEAGGEEDVRWPPARWWRATRPGEVFPPWLRQWCAADPTNDPGYESEWEDVALLPGREVPTTIDFLIHLEPASTAARPTLPGDGWYQPRQGAQIPGSCPRGVVTEASQHQTGATEPLRKIFAAEVLPAIEHLESQPLDDDGLLIIPAQIPLLYRLARFCDRRSLPQFRFRGPKLRERAASSNGTTVVLSQDEKIGILFAADAPPEKHERSLLEFSSWFRELPVDARWELCCAAPDDESGEQSATPFRFIGNVTRHGWYIRKTYPSLPTRELEKALQLALEGNRADFMQRYGEDWKTRANEPSEINHQPGK